MSQQIINVGSAPNDGTGDLLRNSQIKANANFTELYLTKGDMFKSVYDTDDDGIVDSAKKEIVQFINKSGATITKGTIVYLKSTSSSSTYPEVIKANATTEATSSKTIGAVYEDVLNDATGFIVTSGEVRNLNTSAYVIGDKLWLSTTDGLVTTTVPTQPNHAVFIGTVTRAQTVNGRVLYAIQNGYELNELHNVLITTPTNNQVLTYESATSLWKNKDASGGGGSTDYISYFSPRAFIDFPLNDWQCSGNGNANAQFLGGGQVSCGTSTTPNSTFALQAVPLLIPPGYIIDEILVNLNYKAFNTTASTLQFFIQREETDGTVQISSGSNPITISNDTLVTTTGTTANLRRIESLAINAHSLPSLAFSYLQIAIRETQNASYNALQLEIKFKKV